MFPFKTIVTINDVEYSYGPHGYAHYYHEKKKTWEMSASISNEKLEEIEAEAWTSKKVKVNG